ncbi:putative leucine-rich repeat domain, L domain-containing protein [Medicago truncatula]|uniref:Putative leucine-rich repeat domain, L domain-containing protein n=1 Tax=Medicago truncatula TaxID=3880 RepID=A0A396I4B2_MEDTR|nr:putative leucine-rich repeat domain, L domain-containing protein [Medicago truncatula]
MIGLKEFSQNITTLTSLTCSHISRPQSIDMLIIADCFPFLEELDLSYPSYCENSMFDRVKTLLSALSNLQKVNLTKHSYINNQFLFHLFNSCKCLEEAIIFRCPEVTNVGIASALGEALTLRSLSFTNYFEPQECSMLFDLVKNSPSLSEIRMEYNFENSFETSNSFMDLVVRPQLKSLCLTHNSRLRDETIKIFSSIFPNLQLLDLINCSGISDEGICEVLRCCKIRQLNLARSLKVKLLWTEL